MCFKYEFRIHKTYILTKKLNFMVEGLTKKKAIVKLLELLEEGDFSGAEISSKLGTSYGSVRTILSFLIQLDFVESVPQKKRGKPYRLTKYGKQHLKRIMEDAE